MTPDSPAVRLHTALETLDLETIAELAAITTASGPSARLALLQRLMNQLDGDLEQRERLLDLSDVIATSPSAIRDTRGLLAQLRQAADRRFGPLGWDVIEPVPLVLGFLKTGAIEREAGPPGPVPSIDQWMEIFDKRLEALPPLRVQGGIPASPSVRPVGGRTDCTVCGGKGRVDCTKCGGNGGATQEELQRAFAAARRQVQADIARRESAGTLLRVDAVRLLRPDKLCDACSGEGSSACECEVRLELPAGAGPGWVCRLLDRRDEQVGLVRIAGASS